MMLQQPHDSSDAAYLYHFMVRKYAALCKDTRVAIGNIQAMLLQNRTGQGLKPSFSHHEKYIYNPNVKYDLKQR